MDRTDSQDLVVQSHSAELFRVQWPGSCKLQVADTAPGPGAHRGLAGRESEHTAVRMAVQSSRGGFHQTYVEESHNEGRA
jgi:hypothetical protein